MEKTILAIFIDFNGVLDIKDSYKINESMLSFRTIAQTDEIKAYKILSFAFDHDILLIGNSTLSNQVSIVQCLYKKLMNSNNQKYKAFAEQEGFKEYIRKCKYAHRSADSKSERVNSYISSMNEQDVNFKYAVLDDEPIPNVDNLIYVGFDRLEDEHIIRAKAILGIQ